MMRWLVLPSMLAALPAAATSAVMVGQLRPQGVDKELVSTLGELLAGELASRTSRSVSTEAQALATLKAGAAAQALGNQVDTEHLAAQFQSDFLLTGSVGRVGRIFVLSLDVAALSAPAKETLAGRRNHWSLVAEAEPESLIVAAQKGAEAVATTLMTAEEQRQAALAAARAQAEEQARRKEQAEEQSRKVHVSQSQVASLAADTEQMRLSLLAALNSGLPPPLAPDAGEGPHGDVSVAPISSSSPSAALREDEPDAAPQVEILASDPTNLAAQPQWHDLAVQDLGRGEQARLLAKLRRRLPLTK